MKIVRRIFSVILAIAMCLAVNTFAYAAETSSNINSIPTVIKEVNNEVASNLVSEATYLVSDSGIMPLSSVNGYNQKTISGSPSRILISCNGSGTGGMGITVQASCSYGNYQVRFSGRATKGSASTLSGGSVLTNSTVEYHNLWQSNLSEYELTFTTSPGTPAYLVKVWIYG